jgi:nucleotide-binding universal stress UspA family protein
MKRIVIGYDGGEGGRDALALARLLAAEDTVLIVGAVLPYEPVPWIDTRGYDRALADHFDSLFEPVGSALGGLEFDRRELHDSSPARALQELAVAEKADLVVLGSSHRSKLGRISPGSVGERMLSGAPIAIAIAPRGFAAAERHAISSIGVAYDARPESDQALVRADELRGQLGGSLRLISVVPHSSLLVQELAGAAPELGAAAQELFDQTAYFEALRQHLRERLDSATANLKSVGETESLLEEGDPAKVLEAHSGSLDLLVIGSRGYGPVRRVLLGGVSTKVVRAASCPILVVPRAGVHGDELPEAGTA